LPSVEHDWLKLSWIGVGTGKFLGVKTFLPEFPQNDPKNFWATFYAIFV